LLIGRRRKKSRQLSLFFFFNGPKRYVGFF